MNHPNYLKDENYWGFNHKEVCAKFEGHLSYVGYMSTKSGGVFAVYKAAKPNLKKGHKKYCILYCLDGKTYINGQTEEQINEYAEYDAVLCTQCHNILYSLDRHHYHKCGCSNETMVDGGRDYLRFGGKDLDKVKHGKYNVLTGKWSPNKEKSKS